MAGRNKETVTLTLPMGAKTHLEALAERLGFFWGKQPSPSALVAAIAEGVISAGPPFALTPEQTDALLQAVQVLSQAGDFKAVRTIGALLWECADLSGVQRQSLTDLPQIAPEVWWSELQRLIEARQPFVLRGVDRKGVACTWHVRHAVLVRQAGKGYLLFYADETVGCDNIPELEHTWLVAVADVQSVLVTSGTWIPDLDTILAVVRPLLPSGPGEERTIPVQSAYLFAIDPAMSVHRYEVVSPPSLRVFWRQHLEEQLRRTDDTKQEKSSASRIERHWARRTLRNWILDPSGDYTDLKYAVRSGPLPPDVLKACCELRPDTMPTVYGAYLAPSKALRRSEHRLSFNESVQGILTLEWVKTLHITTLIEGARPDSWLIIIFEDPEKNTCLVGLALRMGGKKQEFSITARELGFTPSEQPWRFWTVLA